VPPSLECSTGGRPPTQSFYNSVTVCSWPEFVSAAGDAGTAGFGSLCWFGFTFAACAKRIAAMQRRLCRAADWQGVHAHRVGQMTALLTSCADLGKTAAGMGNGKLNRRGYPKIALVVRIFSLLKQLNTSHHCSQAQGSIPDLSRQRPLSSGSCFGYAYAIRRRENSQFLSDACHSTSVGHILVAGVRRRCFAGKKQLGSQDQKIIRITYPMLARQGRFSLEFGCAALWGRSPVIGDRRMPKDSLNQLFCASRSLSYVEVPIYYVIILI
jgi:hypothetical protein